MAQTCCGPIEHKITEERIREIRKAAQLVEKIRTLGGLSIRDRTYHLRNYSTCFVASELIDWFVSSGEAETRDHAIELGQLLVNTDYIHHVVDEHNFEDAYLFFRFRQDEPPEMSLKGPSVAYMKGQSGAVASLLAKKRLVLGWNNYYFVFFPKNRRLYQYKSELDSSPLCCWDLSGYSVQPEGPRSTADSAIANSHQKFILHLHNSDKDKAGISLAASSSDIQFNWLRTLQGAGLTVLPAANEVDDLVKNASSIFDFEVKDIDGQLVPLERYRGHVTLIVNVASQ